MSFKQKTVLITGACGGLGRATANAFLAEGANVAVCDINDELIADYRDKVCSAHPEATLVVKADVTSEAGLDELFAQVEKRFGGLDAVVNNAAIIDRFDPTGTMDLETWNRVIAINLTAPAFVIKRAVNAFAKHGTKGGAIVNIASLAALRGFTCGAAYTASKHGIIGLTKNTAAFYGPKGIRCNAVLPGAMATNISSSLANGLNMEGLARMRVNFPEEGGMPMCDVDQVASLVVYLCSDKAGAINGSTVSADSGATAN